MAMASSCRNRQKTLIPPASSKHSSPQAIRQSTARGRTVWTMWRSMHLLMTQTSYSNGMRKANQYEGRCPISPSMRYSRPFAQFPMLWMITSEDARCSISQERLMPSKILRHRWRQRSVLRLGITLKHCRHCHWRCRGPMGFSPSMPHTILCMKPKLNHSSMQ